MEIDVMVFNDNIEEVYKGKADIPWDGIGHDVKLRNVSGEDILSDFKVQLTRGAEEQVCCYIGKEEDRICFTGLIMSGRRVSFFTPHNFRTGKFVKTPWEITRMEVG